MRLLGLGFWCWVVGTDVLMLGFSTTFVLGACVLGVWFIAKLFFMRASGFVLDGVSGVGWLGFWLWVYWCSCVFSLFGCLFSCCIIFF